MSAPPVTGLVEDLDEAEYHRHPALSVSGAKKLLPPSCPARFRYEQLHGQAPRNEFDVGHAAHKAVLGVGGEVVIVQKVTKDKTRCDAEDYKTVSAQQHRDEIRAEGKIPLLVHEKAMVDAMAAALLQHEQAASLFDPEHGRPEVSMFWRDVASDVDRRARADWLPNTDGGRLVLVDYKTCASAEPSAIRKAVANYGYHQQHGWYVDGAIALGLAEDVGFRFVFQEKVAPYLVTVVKLDTDAVFEGRRRNDEALRIYRECLEWDTWPSYSSDVLTVSLPPWAYGRGVA